MSNRTATLLLDALRTPKAVLTVAVQLSLFASLLTAFYPALAVSLGPKSLLARLASTLPLLIPAVVCAPLVANGMWSLSRRRTVRVGVAAEPYPRTAPVVATEGEESYAAPAVAREPERVRLGVRQ